MNPNGPLSVKFAKLGVIDPNGGVIDPNGPLGDKLAKWSFMDQTRQYTPTRAVRGKIIQMRLQGAKWGPKGVKRGQLERCGPIYVPSGIKN